MVKIPVSGKSWELVEAGGKRIEAALQLLRLLRVIAKEEEGNWRGFSKELLMVSKHGNGYIGAWLFQLATHGGPQ